MLFTLFDALSMEKALRKAGMPRPQAEALVNVNMKLVEHVGEALVSKKDLRLALAECRHDILRWMMGLLLAQTALLATFLASLKSMTLWCGLAFEIFRVFKTAFK